MKGKLLMFLPGLLMEQVCQELPIETNANVSFRKESEKGKVQIKSCLTNENAVPSPDSLKLTAGTYVFMAAIALIRRETSYDAVNVTLTDCKDVLIKCRLISLIVL